MPDQLLAPRFDETPVEGTTLDDLELQEAETHLDQALRANRYPGEARTPLDMLIEQHAVVPHGDTYIPTVAGMLIFGRYPQRHLPHATVSLAHYHGNIIHSGQVRHFQEYGGTIPQQFMRVAGYLSSSMNTGYKLVAGQLQRIEIPQYPALALRELTVNALVHRDYQINDTATRISMFQNRIDWISPGELVEGVTIETILHQQKARNPTLLRLLFQRSFVERIGQGLDTVFDECERVGLPTPTMRLAFGAFTISITGHELIGAGAHRPQLSETQIDIVDLLQSDRGRSINVTDVVSYFADVRKRPRSKRAIQEDLKALVDAGIIERIGNSVASTYILRDVSPSH